MAGESALELRERGRELQVIERALTAAASADGRVVAIEGPAGIGKTTLVAAARERARAAGMAVLSARGSDLERDFPWGVVRQLIEPVLFGGECDRWFTGAAALARPLFEHAHEVAAPTEPELQFQRRHGLYWLVANLARERPVLVAVDDAQWADDPSIGFLRHLAPRLEHLPVLLLIACRPHHDGVSALLVEPAATVLRPEPLTVAEVGRWVAEELGDSVEAPFAAACHAATGGNPFLIRELLREIRSKAISPTVAGADDVGDLSPRGVMTAVLVRLGRLPAGARALARAAAVLGEAELPVVAQLAGVAETDALDAAAGLVDAGVLEADDTAVRFLHPLVRSTLYEDVPPAERALVHARAARLLRERGADPDRVAAQLVRAPRIGERWALEVLTAAAWQATANGAPEVAARFLERAASEADEGDERFEVVLALGRAATLAGAPRALDHLRRAVELARTPAQYARAAIKLARTLRYSGAGGEAVDLLERAAAGLGQGEGEAALAVRIVHELLAASTVSFAARAKLAERRAQWWTHVSDPPVSFFDRLQYGAWAVEAVGRGEPAATVMARCELAQLETAGRDHLGRHLRLLVAYATSAVDAFDRAYAALEQVLEDARAGGGVELVAVALAQRAHVSFRAGRLPAAEADAIDALQLAADLHTPPAFLLTAGAALLHVAAEQGEPPHPLAAILVDDGDSFFGRHLRHGQATLDIAQGRVEQGLARLLALGERERAIGWHGPALIPWRAQAALALAVLGDGAEARRLAEEELALARTVGAGRALGIALRALALVDGADAIDLLEEAVATLAGSGSELEYARALVDSGSALRRAGRRTRGREFLREGHERALRCGGALVAERARQELMAAGARPRRTALSGPESLTPSERRVVELAANELTNRQIAETLYVTEKTVETHLSRAFAKLHVHSRRALAGVLAGS